MATMLGKVLGLGSARSGTDEFVHDRLRSALLFFMTPYVVGIGVCLFGQPLDYVTHSLALSWVGVPLAVYLVLTLLHMRHGMQTIIEDYIHTAALKFTLTLANVAFCLGLSATLAYALIRIFATG